MPLFGTWVGTILAFYFSKANFEAATKSVTKIAETKIASIDEKLSATLVSEKMINPEDLDLIKVIDQPQAVVEAIFQHYETRGFTPSAVERENMLSL